MLQLYRYAYILKIAGKTMSEEEINAVDGRLDELGFGDVKSFLQGAGDKNTAYAFCEALLAGRINKFKNVGASDQPKVLEFLREQVESAMARKQQPLAGPKPVVELAEKQSRRLRRSYSDEYGEAVAAKIVENIKLIAAGFDYQKVQGLVVRDLKYRYPDFDKAREDMVNDAVRYLTENVERHKQQFGNAQQAGIDIGGVNAFEDIQGEIDARGGHSFGKRVGPAYDLVGPKAVPGPVLAESQNYSAKEVEGWDLCKGKDDQGQEVHKAMAGTRWCVRFKDTFDSYKRDGERYFIIYKNDRPFVLFGPKSGQFKDREDLPIALPDKELSYLMVGLSKKVGFELTGESKMARMWVDFPDVRVNMVQREAAYKKNAAFALLATRDKELINKDLPIAIQSFSEHGDIDGLMITLAQVNKLGLPDFQLNLR